MDSVTVIKNLLHETRRKVAQGDFESLDFEDYDEAVTLLLGLDNAKSQKRLETLRMSIFRVAQAMGVRSTCIPLDHIVEECSDDEGWNTLCAEMCQVGERQAEIEQSVHSAKVLENMKKLYRIFWYSRHEPITHWEGGVIVPREELAQLSKRIRYHQSKITH